MIKRMNRDELVSTVHEILNPQGFTSEEINQKLLAFSINCPDPAAAMDLIIEPGGPDSAEAIVTEALARAPRDPETLPESELHRDHPLRHMKLDPR